MDKCRWILAFDSSCSKCSRISSIVTDIAGNRVETRSLVNTDVIRWRREALGPDPKWEPTLLGVGPDRVRAWTGTSIALPMLKLMGPRRTVRLLRALGEFSSSQPAAAQAVSAGAGGSEVPAGMRPSRRRLLLVGTGAVVAGMAMLGGAGRSEAAPAYRWLQRNLDNLPRGYDDIARYPRDYRRAIVVQLPAEHQNRLWSEHLARYRAAHPSLSADQERAFRAARNVAADPATFRRDRPAEATAKLDEMGVAMVAAFGVPEARAIVSMLGPDSDPVRFSTTDGNCNCNLAASYCNHGCVGGGCAVGDWGCGNLWSGECNGNCG